MRAHHVSQEPSFCALALSHQMSLHASLKPMSAKLGPEPVRPAVCRSSTITLLWETRLENGEHVYPRFVFQEASLMLVHRHSKNIWTVKWSARVLNDADWWMAAGKENGSGLRNPNEQNHVGIRLSSGCVMTTVVLFNKGSVTILSLFTLEFGDPKFTPAQNYRLSFSVSAFPQSDLRENGPVIRITFSLRFFWSCNYLLGSLRNGQSDKFSTAPSPDKLWPNALALFIFNQKKKERDEIQESGIKP